MEVAGTTSRCHPQPGTVLESRFMQFAERPLSDSCWSLHTGPDGRVYASACAEHSPGESVTVVRHRTADDTLEYLFDMDVVTGDLRDSGRATHCKIHYSFAPSPATGILYAATHLSGAPKGETSYNPWAAWHDTRRSFRGAYLAAYDTKADAIAWTALMIPKEGCRCLCLDEARGRLYALTYPRDHFVVYDIAKKELTDVGRVGSVNCQCLFSDSRGRIFFTNDQGVFMRFDPDKGRMEALPLVYPHEWSQNGWHGVLYDAAADPATGAVYMIPWMVRPRLARLWPEEGPHGRLEDLGPVTFDRDPRHPISMSIDHVGGLVFGADGCLYFVRAVNEGADLADSAWGSDKMVGGLVRFNPTTSILEEVAVLRRPGSSSNYVSRGARDAAGDLFFGHVGPRPVGIFHVKMSYAEPTDPLSLRLWG